VLSFFATTFDGFANVISPATFTALNVTLLLTLFCFFLLSPAL